MKCIVSHITACIWYAHNRSPRDVGDRASRVTVVGARIPPARYIEKLRFMLGISDGKLDFLVADPNELRHGSNVIGHLCTCELPPGSLIRIPSGFDDVKLYVTSPELTFVHMSHASTMHASIYAGMALCSDYRLDPYDRAGVLERPQSDGPITSVHRISQYLERAVGIPGRKRAKLALSHVYEHSRSPKESALALFYGLPVRLGGMALGDITMNPLVRVYGGKDMFGSARYEERYPDILIERALPDNERLAVAMDYDSDAAHAGAEKTLEDKRRANSIATVDRLVHYSISTTDLDDYSYLLLLGDRARKCLKLPVRPRLHVSRRCEEGRLLIAQYQERQKKLWKELILAPWAF